MRFSAAFTLPLPAALSARPVDEGAPAQSAPAAQAQAEASRIPADLPDDLDARVRLVGEWQLGEAAE